jgi:hypothetical protein
MALRKSRKLTANTGKPDLKRQAVAGDAAAAEKNLENEVRLAIIQAFGRLGTPFNTD